MAASTENTSLLAEFNWEEDEGMKEVVSLSTEQITSRARLLENETRLFESEIKRIRLDIRGELAKTKENNEKVKLNKQLPWLVGNIVEVCTIPLPFLTTILIPIPQVLDNPEDGADEDGSNMDADKNHGKAVVIKTSTRQVSEGVTQEGKLVVTCFVLFCFVFQLAFRLSTCLSLDW